ncbi:MAG: DUF6232 family protein [Fulvivirga sp.]
MEEDILYSDFNGVRITSKRFYTDEKSFAINKIKSINLKRVIPNKKTGFILFTLGILTILLGSFEVLGIQTIEALGDVWIVNFDIISIAIGVVALVIAILRMLIAPDEYAVKVEIKGGKVEDVISDNRKYAARIAASLKRAYYRQSSKASAEETMVLS